MEKTNLKNIETYITIYQLRFLSRIMKMETTRLTHQLINSQAIQEGKCAKGIHTTKFAYKDALMSADLFKKGLGFRVRVRKGQYHNSGMNINHER